MSLVEQRVEGLAVWAGGELVICQTTCQILCRSDAGLVGVPRPPAQRLLGGAGSGGTRAESA